MKQITTLLIILLFSTQSFSTCDLGHVSVYPSNKDINENPLIIIEGYANSQSFVTSINKTSIAYLEADGHKVKLIPIAINKGGFLVTQVILKPEEKLREGKTYSLSVGNLDKGEKSYFSQWNEKTKKSESFSWTVEYHVDFTEPVWIKKPSYVSSSVKQFSDGPEVNAVFKLEVLDRSKVLIEANLVDITTKESTKFFLRYDGKGEISVGHGMCSGAFNFKAKHQYKIQFSLMDYSGNSTDKWTKWILFDSPFDKKE